MLERAIQERLGRANLGLNVRHDLNIEPATRSVPSLPGNVCSTRSDGLLIGYEVACQFESHPLRRQRVRDAGSKQIHSRRSAQQLRCKARQVPCLPVKILTPTR